MILKKIIIEGDSKYESEKKLFPIRWKSHHITELFMELCPQFELDGNRQLTIFATRNRRKGAAKYNNYKSFHVSSYYLESEQIEKLEFLKDTDAERYILELIKDVLIDIVDEYDKNKDKRSVIENTTKRIMEMDFSLKKRIDKLCKKKKNGKNRAEVIRWLDKEVGEAWYVEFINEESRNTRIEWLTDKTNYLDRRDYFKKAEWEGNRFIIRDKLGEEVISIDVLE